MKRLIIFLSLICMTAYLALGQQTIRGVVYDMQTLSPLVGAKVMLLNSEPINGTLTNEQGEFRLKNVPIGRQSVAVRYYGYAPVTRANLIINSAQELVLEIKMEEQVTSMEEVSIVATNSKEGANNELSTVSARVFSMEEANRFAGSRNDPARMAQNFAGVSGAEDSRNDIIIRGNSPTGVLWRLEGIDIPNPNHFGALGTTGGPVSMLNNNNLSDADFFTSAFPAEYGNALAGVFDLGLRNGNNERTEIMGQIGFNGFEAGIEGPFSKNSRASYVINYRYSTLGVFNALGIDFGTGAAIPQYQDLTFKVNIPTKNAGRFELFGIGGNSEITFLAEDETDNFFSDEGQDLFNRGAVGVVGLSHTYLFSNKTYGKLTIAASGIRSEIQVDSPLVAEDPVRLFGAQNSNVRYSAHYQFNHKFNTRNLLRVGVMGDLLQVGLLDSTRQDDGSYFRFRDVDDRSGLVRAYATWQHRFNNQLTLNAGAYSQLFTLNNAATIEPRLGLKYKTGPTQSLNLGFGVHSQLQPLQVYFLQTRLNDGSIVRTNEDLDFSRSLQIVLGYDRQLGNNWRMKAEVYYQSLDRIPVERFSSTFSLINAGANFVFPDVDNLVNDGTGQNLGAELTLEKFFSKGFYFLFTASVFDSKYTASNGETYNTAFNGNYVINSLAGREFKLGEKNTLSFDIRLTYAGGRRYSPINLEASRAAGETIRIETDPFSEQYDAYFRADFKTTFRMNMKKIAQEFSVDLQNVTNRDNIFDQGFSRRADGIVNTYQIGLFPVIQYRILF